MSRCMPISLPPLLDPLVETFSCARDRGGRACERRRARDGVRTVFLREHLVEEMGDTPGPRVRGETRQQLGVDIAGELVDGEAVLALVPRLLKEESSDALQDVLFVHSALGEGSLDETSAVVTFSAEVSNEGQDVDAIVRFSLSGLGANQTAEVPITLPAGGSATAAVNMTLEDPKLWSAMAPNLYDVQATIIVNQQEVDRIATSHGVRSLRYDADEGFFLNEDHFKVRGFCDHNSFAIVGMAVPQRVSLFRAQASRAVGGNGRRTSHNPPESAVLQACERAI